MPGLAALAVAAAAIVLLSVVNYMIASERVRSGARLAVRMSDD